MTIDAHLLRNRWAVERISLLPNTIAYSLLPIKTYIGSLCASVSSSNVAILIPVSDSDVFSETRESNIEFIRVEVDCGEGLQSYLQLSCQVESLEKVFSNLCADLINEVHVQAKPGISSRIFFDKWRVLFAKSRKQSLSTNALVGLVGELMTLQQIVGKDDSRSIDYWVGPDGAPQDFAKETLRIEVKSTSNLNELKVAISSVHQLETENIESLHLVIHRVISEESGSNISEIIEGLLAMGVDRISLYEKLGAVGFDWSDPDQYRKERFKVVSTYWFKVDDHFPRIVPQSFENGFTPNGVEEIRYAVNLGSGSEALTQNQVLDAINSFLGRSE